MMFDDNQIQCPSCQCRLTGLQWNGDIKSIEKAQIRMQALELLANLNVKSGGDFCKEFWQDVDKIVHYCLTGEHPLPEK